MDNDSDREDNLYRRRKTFLQIDDDDWRVHRAPAVNKYTLRMMKRDELSSYLTGCGGYDLEQTCRMFNIPLMVGKGRERRRLRIEEMRDVLRERLIKEEV